MGGMVAADLDASIDRVWSLVGDFGNVQRWNPLVVRCDLEGEGVGAIRTIRFADWSVIERLDHYDQQAYELEYSIMSSGKPNLGRIDIQP